MTETIPQCEICFQKMVALPEKTFHKGLDVFVCAKPFGKAKVPCDGPAWANATKRS